MSTQLSPLPYCPNTFYVYTRFSCLEIKADRNQRLISAVDVKMTGQHVLLSQSKQEIARFEISAPECCTWNGEWKQRGWSRASERQKKKDINCTWMYVCMCLTSAHTSALTCFSTLLNLVAIPGYPNRVTSFSTYMCHLNGEGFIKRCRNTFHFNEGEFIIL
jgi:hypothetical protein